MTIKKLLGARIKELRKEKKFSQEQLAELINMNPRQIVRIENGESFPTAENLEKIAEIFKINPQEFFLCDYAMEEDKMREAISKKLTNLSGKSLRTLYIVASNL